MLFRSGHASHDRKSSLFRVLHWRTVGLWSLALIALCSGRWCLAAGDGAPTSQILTVEGLVEVSRAGRAEWAPAKPNQFLAVGDRLRTAGNSRACVRLSDRSTFRVNELTTLQIQAEATKDGTPWLDLKSGSVYFFSREKPDQLHFRTPFLVGAIRGTEFHLLAREDGETRLALLDGEVTVTNQFGNATLRTGEEVLAQPGRAPVKKAMIEAINIIQWCLYYPGVLDLGELELNETERREYGPSLEAYRQGDLLRAIERFPSDIPPGTDAARIYLAALKLACGQVSQAEEQLRACQAGSALADALRELVAAVQFKLWTRPAHPTLATVWLAESYYLQSRGQLEPALAAARSAVAKDSSFGFAWVRVAELEFSFGRVPAALEALNKGLTLSPRNAQGLALKGFLLSARHQIDEALAAFDQAIAVDGGLGNAWLGRGLCRIRQSTTFFRVTPSAAKDARQDLQVAAALEPNRALLRSYLAKAFNEAGEDALAQKDIRLARTLDPNDPTAWLYGALLNQQRNRVNDAIRELERSQELNGNRAVLRSRLLLDQDRAVQGANLASAYRDAGMFDVSVREASRAVSYDYANYSAHLFLAESYDSLTDPKNFNLRYETARTSELLMANLLAPAGAANLSRNISQQDYSRLLEGNRLGFSSSSEYFSGGDWVQNASTFGNFGSSAFAIDTAYRSERGQRPNNDLEQTDFAVQLKQQFTPADSVYIQATRFDAASGDIAQYYNQAQASQTLRVKEIQEPNLYLGYHHEWSPGVHTLLLASRLEDDLSLTDQNPKLLFLRVSGNDITRVITPPFFHLNYSSHLELYSTELQQIWQTPSQTLILGGRYQTGANDTRSVLDRDLSGVVTDQTFSTDLERLALYGYHHWQVLETLRLTTGLSYDHLTYPRNIDISPISGDERDANRVSPKIGVLFTPQKWMAVRGLHAQSLGGAFSDNSIRLEPTQISGFNQAFRSIIPESAAGIAPGTTFENGEAAFDLKFKDTFITIGGEILQSRGRRTVGALTNASFLAVPDSPSSTEQKLDFEEKTLTLTLNQLIKSEWSVGGKYRLSRADLMGRFTDIPLTASGVSAINQDQSAILHQLNLFAIYNHPSGFFSQLDTVWSAQSSMGYVPNREDQDFWQLNFFVGYRFPRRKAEIRLGFLNLTDHDYQLNPLTLYSELPRERMVTARLKLNF